MGGIEGGKFSYCSFCLPVGSAVSAYSVLGKMAQVCVFNKILLCAMQGRLVFEASV